MGLIDKELEELESFRQKQLSYQSLVISNNAFNERFGVIEFKHTIRGARWCMLGHVLRMTDDTPAKCATIHYFDDKTESFKGRPRTTLATVFEQDLKLAAQQQDKPVLLNLPAQLKNRDDMRLLEELATDRLTWKSIVENMHVLEPPRPTRRRPRGNDKQ